MRKRGLPVAYNPNKTGENNERILNGGSYSSAVRGIRCLQRRVHTQTGGLPMSFFKTSAPESGAAVRKFLADMGDLVAHAEAFAERFGVGKPVYAHSNSEARLYGIKFGEKLDNRFWTKPDKQAGTQSPRKNVTGTKDEKAGQKALYDLWVKLFPREKACKEAIYASLGITWADTIFSGLSWFWHDETLYVSTELKINATEIFGSEYEAAKGSTMSE
jgi:hypothetical protein